MNLCPRKSVGAVITDNQDRHLCLYRKKHPLGLAGIAGHLDFVDEEKGQLEDWIDALNREVNEESGLVVLGRRPLIVNKVFPNPCGKGDYDGHEWTVFQVTKYSGMVQLMEPDKHQWVRFLTPDEIMNYVTSNDVDPAWLYIWTYMGLIK